MPATTATARSASPNGVFSSASPEATAEWSGIVAALEGTAPKSTLEMWIAPLRPVALRGETLYLTGPEATCTWVERRFRGLIDHAIANAEVSAKRISFERPEPEEQVSRAGSITVNPTHTFERFVIGPGNHLAHSAALAVAEAPSEAYNPLFLHAPPGLGKTHLLGAIANYLEQHVPDLNVLYTDGESFTSEFTTALKTEGIQRFKRRYRNLDVLLVDDIQFIAGKNSTQEEFLYTFNALHQAGAQIVLSSDRTPQEITSLAENLSDRFEWGLTVQLERPNLATRLTVLRHLITEAGLEITDQEALTLLARRVEDNLRQLRGALTRTLAEASLRATPITVDLVTGLLPGRAERPEPPGAEEIRDRSAEQFGLEAADLIGRRRDARTRDARNIAIYLTREMTDLSLPRIGQLYGDRDHSTILNSIRRIESSLNSDPGITTAVETVRARLHSPDGDRPSG